MQRRAIILIIAAVLIGGAAIYLMQIWIDTRVAERAAELAAIQKVGVSEEGLAKVVVARTQLNFGDQLTRDQLTETNWPKSSIPTNAFTNIEELIDEGPRFVLQSMQPQEVILSGKVTGPGERASLSSIIDTDMRAVTIRVNDVWGVGGFVLPGDRVDILLTRELNKDEEITDILLQNAKVLGIDQIADDQTKEPTVVKSVTVEVSPSEAQKLALGTKKGTLSLALRRAGYVENISTNRIALRDLGPAFGRVVDKPKGRLKRAATSSLQSVTIIRGMERTKYSVPRDRLGTPKS